MTTTLESQLVQQYHEQGFTTVKGLIPRDLIDAIREQLARTVRGDHDWPDASLQVLDPDRYRADNGRPVPWGVQLPSRYADDFKAVADHPNLQAAMRELLGGAVARHTDQALCKPGFINEAQGGCSYYHQDSYYWKLQPRLGCNAWIALNEVGPKAIALAIMPGSHSDWQIVEHESYYDDPSAHHAVTGQRFMRHRITQRELDAVDLSKEVLLPMEPGDAAFFTNFTWHRSEPNRSGEDKFAYAIAYRLAEEPA